jgi:DNA-binding IscR family transcriptional regulator
MVANTRLATAIQILCVIAHKGEAGTNSQIIAKSLRTNPVVVRRLLKAMERQGLVAIRPGKDGGVQLARPADRITLDEIHKSVETDARLFALRPGPNPNCPVGMRMPGLLAPIFGAADAAVARTFQQTTLDSLVQTIA